MLVLERLLELTRLALLLVADLGGDLIQLCAIDRSATKGTLCLAHPCTPLSWFGGTVLSFFILFRPYISLHNVHTCTHYGGCGIQSTEKKGHWLSVVEDDNNGVLQIR